MRYLFFTTFGIFFVCSVECGPRRNEHCRFSFNGKKYDIAPDDPWPGKNKCFSCECVRPPFGIKCQKKQCPELSCRTELRKFSKDGCCEYCSGCYNEYEQAVVSEGKTFKSPEGCIWKCENNSTLVMTTKCPEIFCHKSMVEMGDCGCKKCRNGCYDTKYGNKEIPENSTFMTPDGCKTCTCRPSGAIYCQANPCQDLGCPLELYIPPAPGQCCPVACKPGCYDTRYGRHVRFGPFITTDGCEWCTCNKDRSIDCDNLKKPCVVPCRRELWLPVKKGQCCPTCRKG